MRPPAAPLDRIDIASAAAVTVGTSAPHAAARTPAVRWVDQPVITFPWEDMTAYLTPADIIALVGAAVLLIRFIAWVARACRPVKED